MITFWKTLMDLVLCPRIFSLGFIKDERGSVKQTFVNMANFVMQIFLKSLEKSSTVNKGPDQYFVSTLETAPFNSLFQRIGKWKGFHLILSCRRKTASLNHISFVKYINLKWNINKYYISFYEFIAGESCWNWYFFHFVLPCYN